MFRLSKAADYAIRGILHLCKSPPGSVSYSADIALNQNIPRSFLPKVFQSLTRKGIIKSVRGATGGFTLMKSPEDITMFEVIEAVEGPLFLNECMIHRGYCNRDEMCPVHIIWKDLQQEFFTRLKNENFWAIMEKERILSERNYRSNCRGNHIESIQTNCD